MVGTISRTVGVPDEGSSDRQLLIELVLLRKYRKFSGEHPLVESVWYGNKSMIRIVQRRTPHVIHASVFGRPFQSLESLGLQYGENQIELCMIVLEP